MDSLKLGERLRIARTSVGLTQEEVIDKVADVKLSRTTLVAIEKGDRQVRPEELVALAKVYKTTVHGLLRESAIHVELIGQFRQTLTRPKDETVAEKRDQAAADALRLLQRLATSYAELELQLGKQSPMNYPPERPLQRGKAEPQAEDLAIEVRSRLGIGIAPIPDLVSLLEIEMGARIFLRPLPSHISGVFAYHQDIGACVLLNSKHPKARRAWTLAHELAHLLTRRNVVAVDMEGVVKSPYEVFADLFASALMMPGVAIRRAFSEIADTTGRFSARHLILLAHRFHVSVEAMCRRLEQLELLPTGTYEALRERGLSADVVREVLGNTPIEESAPPPRLAILATEAYFKGVLSEGQLADMLMMDRIEIRRLIDALDDGDLMGAER